MADGVIFAADWGGAIFGCIIIALAFYWYCTQGPFLSLQWRSASAMPREWNSTLPDGVQRPPSNGPLRVVMIRDDEQPPSTVTIRMMVAFDREHLATVHMTNGGTRCRVYRRQELLPIATETKGFQRMIVMGYGRLILRDNWIQISQLARGLRQSGWVGS